MGLQSLLVGLLLGETGLGLAYYLSGWHVADMLVDGFVDLHDLYLLTADPSGQADVAALSSYRDLLVVVETDGDKGIVGVCRCGDSDYLGGL